ncbi:Protein casc1 [Chytridiales sp. JEL 0842]|nr:Protein casc1 [Chytridiales sp. JEL 0842]
MAPNAKKKGKKQEADKAVLEEEEKKRIEEEARMQELRAKRERDLKEQKEREALESFIAQEKPRLDEEIEAIKQLSIKQTDEISAENQREQLENDWKKFLECSTIPDPLDEREVNTYLTLLSEETLGGDDEASVQPLLSILPNAEKLCNDIFQAMTAVNDSEETNKGIYNNLRTHLLRVRALIQEKWGMATSRILQHYDLYPVEPNENFSYALSVDNYVFALWGNLTKNPRHKTIEYTNVNLSMTLPKPISLANVSIRMLYESGPTASAPYSAQETDRHMSVVGGVLFLDMFEMPEPAKTCESWVIRQILSPTGKLKSVTYPFKKPVTDAAEEEEKEVVADINIWPAQVTYDIFPSCFIHRETAKVMCWNEAEKRWSEDNIGDVEINIDQGQIRFRTTQFFPTALVQSTYAELLYQDWKLYPTGPSSATIIITGAVNEIEIAVQEGKVSLVRPTSPYLDEHVTGKWMQPALLFSRLSQVGLNFQAPKSLKGLDLDPLILKNPTVEDICTVGLGLCTAGYAFRRSPSNRYLSSSRVSLQFREVADGQVPDMSGKEGWQTILFDTNYQIGGSGYQLGFLVPGDDVDDETKIQLNSEKTVRNVETKAEIDPPTEEHCILRIIDPNLREAMREQVKKRSLDQDVSLMFKDTRNGMFKFKNEIYPTKLVDLPCIIESQKTNDYKQFFKIADISQAIEDVEREVERLLQLDAEAEDVRYEEHFDLPENDNGFNESSLTSVKEFGAPDEYANEDQEGDDGEAQEEDDLAAEIENSLDQLDALDSTGLDEEIEEGMEESDEEESDDEEDDESEAASEEEEGEVDDESRILKEEIADLQAKIQEKEEQAQQQTNPIMRQRFEGIIKKLRDEYENCKQQLASRQQK